MGILNRISGYIVLINILKIVIIIALVIIAKKLISRFIDSQINKNIQNNRQNTKMRTILSILENAISIVIYFIAITFILSIFNIDTTSILAVAGVGGMAIAFASQSVIEDLISGAFIIFENQFNVGDFVTIDGVSGTVESIGVRLTRLIDIDGKEIIIPNGDITKVINHSLNQMRAVVSVFITDNTPYENVEKAINDASIKVFEDSNLFSEQPNLLGIDDMTQFGYTILIQSKTKNGEQFEAQRQLRKEVVKVLQRENINFSNLKNIEEEKNDL